MNVSRRRFLRGVSLTTGALIRVGLPPLAAMFNSNGTAYAATSTIQPRLLFWFNGNGIPERYWIPTETGSDYELSPCLSPLESFRNDVHVISGIDNPAARVAGPGNTHHKSGSGIMTGMPYTGRGAGGPSFEQVLAPKIGMNTRFRSIQVGVGQESHGENIHRNMSWAGYERALPPELIPHNLFDRLFGKREQSWIERKQSVLDVVRDDFQDLNGALGKQDQVRMEEHLASVRDLERSIASLPPEYAKASEPEMTTWTATNSEGYPAPAALAVDTVVLTVREGRLAALAVGGESGALALPGGLVGERERPADTARRKLLEKTGLRRGYLDTRRGKRPAR